MLNHVQVAQSPQFPEGIRQLAAEFLVCLCEAREKAPGMMRKLPQYISQLFSCMLLFLLDVTVSFSCGTRLCVVLTKVCILHPNLRIVHTKCTAFSLIGVVKANLLRKGGICLMQM